MHRVLAIAAVAVTLLGQAVAAHKHDSKASADFRQCLCWNAQTNDFCAGSEWYNTDACTRWASHIFDVQAIIAGTCFILFLAFPILFFVGRWCCNCCGGRHATRGCCCPDNSTRDTFPGYSNCSIGITKGLFYGAFFGGMFFCSMLLIRNDKLDTDIKTSTSLVGGSLDNVSTTLNAANTAVLALATGMPQLAPATLALSVAGMSQQFGPRANDIQDVVRHIHTGETHDWYGRNAITILVVASGMLVLLGAGCTAVCNARRWVGWFMLYMCIHTATMFLLTVPHHLMKEVTEYSCDNFGETIVPLAIGGLTRYGACANSAVDADLATTSSNALSFLTQPSSSFCKDYKEACQNSPSCALSPCLDYLSYTSPVQFVFLASGLNAAQAVTGMINTLVPPQSPSPPVDGAAQRLAYLRDNTLSQLQTVLGNFANVNTNCTFATQQLNGPIRQAICENGVKKRAHEIASYYMLLSYLGFHTVLALVLGMKRFRAWNSYDPFRGSEFHEGSPIMRQGPPMYNPYPAGAQPVVAVCALDQPEVSGVVVAKDVAYVNDPPRTTYGTDGGVAYQRV